MNNKNTVIRQCEYLNAPRRVKFGRATCDEFFSRVSGNLLVSGKESGKMSLIENLVHHYISRGDFSTVVLTSHMELIKNIEFENIRQIITSRDDRNYMPFYKLDAQQIISLISYTAEKLGYSSINSKILLYASALLNIVASQFPLSFPAITKLLEEDDDFISALAFQAGLSNVVADNIRANHEAGIVLRRIFEYMEEVFEDIYEPGRDSEYNFQNAIANHVSGMIMYVCSHDQELMNKWLKEELYKALENSRMKIRVILDEFPFVNPTDELFRFLHSAEKQGRIELVLVTQNVLDLVANANDLALDFTNVIMFQHNNPTVTDELSRKIFGTFQYHYPISEIGDVPHVFFSLRKSVRWDIRAEERLRVCSKDLWPRQSVLGYQSDYMAVKTGANENVYLIKTSEFMPFVNKNEVDSL